MKIYKNQFSPSGAASPRRQATRTDSRHGRGGAGNYASPSASLSSASYGRGQNLVRFTATKKSPLGQIGLAVAMVLTIGLVFLLTSNRITDYDYKMQAMDEEILQLEQTKADLAIDNARATSRAAANRSELAGVMVKPEQVTQATHE